MTKSLTEKWAIITPENCQEINTMISEYKKEIERLQEQLDESIKTTKDQELIIKKLKRRRICDNQKTEARKEHINELIEQVKELKEEIARRGRIINELKIQRKEANAIIEDMRPFIQASMSRQTFTRILNYEDKWGVK